MPQKRKAPSVHSDDGDEDYRTKRDRNNQAVKKSRVKSKQKTVETQDRVRNLKSSNKLLEEKIENHTKTLKFLKELFLAQAQAKPDKMTQAEWQELLKEDEDDDAEGAGGSGAGGGGPSTSGEASASTSAGSSRS